MRKWSLLVAVMALLAVMAFPTMAQDRPDIPTLLSEDGSFTTLLAAVEAAGLVETLSGEGPFTVFAPTDDAFAATLADLGLTAEDVLANPELLTSILTYHVVPGRNFFRTLIAGAELETVQGESLNLFRNSAGVLTVNGVTTSRVDQIASNGVVYFIDNVLLPPGVLPAANVRAAHLSPDTPNVDVYVNGAAALTDVPFGAIGDWIELGAGYYEFAVSPTGTSIDDAAIGPVTLFLAPGSFTTLAAIGSLEAGSLTAQVVAEDFSTVGEGAQVTFFHAIEGAPAVDVLVNGAAAVTNLAFPGTVENADGTTNDGVFSIAPAPGSYDVSVVATGTTSPALLSADAFEVMAGMSYFVVAAGTPTDPQLVVATTNVAELMAMMAE
jgi:uncharacterized surface protein with fasciclin (FAS1) repeats